MSVLKSRTRLLSFRLSLEEYEKLRRVCINENARSISEFARNAVLERVALSGGESTSLPTDLRTLNGRLQALNSVLKETQGQIAKILGT